jgi:hypothetical protein
MAPQPDAASGHDLEQMPLAVLAAVPFGNVPDGLPNCIRHIAGTIAGTLRPVGVCAT